MQTRSPFVMLEPRPKQLERTNHPPCLSHGPRQTLDHGGCDWDKTCVPPSICGPLACACSGVSRPLKVLVYTGIEHSVKWYTFTQARSV